MDKVIFRDYFRKISSFLDSTLLNTGFNGGIIYAKDGAILFEKYVGKIDLRKLDSINSSTAFHVASTSKTFTSIAILRLVQENKLSLDDSLQKFFPGIPYRLCARTAFLVSSLHLLGKLKSHSFVFWC